MSRSIWPVVLALVVLGGCHSQHVANAFAKDHGCPAKSVKIGQLGRERFEASGCGKRAIYRCPGGECQAEK